MQMLVANLAYDDYRGRMAVGRVFNGTVRLNDPVMVLKLGGAEPASADLGLQKHLTALRDSQVRLQELRDCALDALGAQAVCAQLASACPGLVAKELREGDYLMGWAISADQ